jgi:hypothetical protein
LTRCRSARWPSWWVATWLGLASLTGCGQQEIRAIERLPAPAVPASPDRGRVQVRDGNLMTDKGTRLRGATIGIDAAPDAKLDQALFDELAHENGLNAFHVYLENHSDVTGANAAQADLLVELTSQAGMYLMIGIGGGDLNGTYDLPKVRAFWDFYAPRYAARSHVIYEIQNQPELACDAAWQSTTFDMEREIYRKIRKVAPDTHVALFSYHSTPTSAVLGDALDAMEGVVDWSKASVAFHGTAICVPSAELPDVLALARGRGVASLVSEVPNTAPASETSVFEDARVGWFNFHFIVKSRDFVTFRGDHDAAGVTWCPDFGTWPEDAERCTAP